MKLLFLLITLLTVTTVSCKKEAPEKPKSQATTTGAVPETPPAPSISPSPSPTGAPAASSSGGSPQSSQAVNPPTSGDSSTTPPEQTQNQSGDNLVDQASLDYKPTVGDKIHIVTKSKMFKSNESEPAFGAAQEADEEVTATYKKDLECAYRKSRTMAGMPAVETDYGCPALSCGATPKCTEEDIDSKDFGIFSGAKGKKHKCRYVSNGMLFYTESSQWTHDEALREAHLVKSESKTCYMPLPAGDTTGDSIADPCASQHQSQISMSDDLLQSQTKGNKTNEIQTMLFSKFKFSGDISTPDKSVGYPATCDVSDYGAAVGLSLSACLPNGTTGVFSLSFAGLNKDGGIGIPSKGYGLTYAMAGTTMISAKDEGACTLDVEADEESKTIFGKANCTPNFEPNDGAKRVTITDVSFRCKAPATLNYATFGKSSGVQTPGNITPPPPAEEEEEGKGEEPVSQPSQPVSSPVPVASPSPSPSAPASGGIGNGFFKNLFGGLVNSIGNLFQLLTPSSPKPDKVGLFAPSQNLFGLFNSTSIIEFQFGAAGAGWLPAVGDWNGDGVETMALLAPNGVVFIENTMPYNGNADYYFESHLLNHIPIAGDWNRDGKDTLGYYDPKTGKVTLSNSTNGFSEDVVINTGLLNLQPVAGDWDGDGIDSIAFYDNQQAEFAVYLLPSTASPVSKFSFGPTNSNWKPIAGDWNGDGRDSLGLYGDSSATFFLDNAVPYDGNVDHQFQFGEGGHNSLPLAGKWY